MGQTEARIVQTNKAQMDQYLNLFWPKLDQQNTGFLSQQALQTLMVTAYKLFAQQYGYQSARPLEELIAEWMGMFDPQRVGQVAKQDFISTLNALAEGRVFVQGNGAGTGNNTGNVGGGVQQQGQQQAQTVPPVRASLQQGGQGHQGGGVGGPGQVTQRLGQPGGRPQQQQQQRGVAQRPVVRIYPITVHCSP